MVRIATFNVNGVNGRLKLFSPAEPTLSKYGAVFLAILTTVTVDIWKRCSASTNEPGRPGDDNQIKCHKLPLRGQAREASLL